MVTGYGRTTLAARADARRRAAELTYGDSGWFECAVPTYETQDAAAVLVGGAPRVRCDLYLYRVIAYGDVS